MAKEEARRGLIHESRKKVKTKKRKRTVNLTLSPQDLDYLHKYTSYDEKEINNWYKGFKQDCPTGQLVKAEVLEMYSMILPQKNALVFVDQIFRIFDKDGNGSIDFKVRLG